MDGTKNEIENGQPGVRREKARVPRYGALRVGIWDSVALLLRDAKEAAAWNAVECGGFWHGQTFFDSVLSREALS